ESAAIIAFTSAIGGYGGFFIPKAYGSSIALTGAPLMALWGFLLFYVVCLVVTWAVYTRPGAMLHAIERQTVPAPQPASRQQITILRGVRMSHLLDRLTFFKSLRKDTFSDGHGQTTVENRDWEDVYRRRWQHDKVVRSTHGVNCTGSCSWKIYVKSGNVTWETQYTDYPRTRPDLPNHEPRGCARGA